MSPDLEKIAALRQRIASHRFAVWKEPAGELGGDSYTVMHFESVIDLMDLIVMIAETYDELNTANLTMSLRNDMLEATRRLP